ncbi:uncharacterized protein [Rhodnius prolixus]
MNAEDKSNEVKDETSSIKEPNFAKENEKNSTVNTKDVNNGQQYSNKQIKFDKTPTVKTEVSEEHHQEEEVDDDDDDDVDKESNGYNSDQSKEIAVVSSTEETSNEDDANQLEMTIDDENYALSDNSSRSLIQREYSTIEGQNVEINNMEELTYLIEDEDNNGTENELIFILRVQRDTELEEPTDRITRDRSRSIINRQIRPQRGRRRRRRRRGRRRGLGSQEIRQVQQQALPEGPIKGEVEVEDVEYEWITSETVPRGRPRTWRIVPKYKGLTTTEAARQEADLYYSFMNETNPEDVEMAGPNDRQCCVCYENKATRIVIPCGHYCLCYNCAKSIAFSRTTLSSIRIPKTCPLCKAAISAMKRPL